MKYLFFDIECADGARSTMCSFGYVIADLSFNIIEQRDLLINPESEFNLEGRRGRPDVKLAYTREEFLAAPTFDKLYHHIRELLENPEFYIVGHAIENDVKFINMSCLRYGMPAMEFEYFDTQRTYGELNKREKPISLENAMKDFGIDDEVVYHRSDEDARATMLVLKGLLERAKLDFVKYSASAYHCTGKTYDYYWGWNTQRTAEFHDAYREKFTKEYLVDIKEGEENRILRSTVNYKNFLRYIERGAPIGEMSDLLRDKAVCVSLNYEAENYRQMLTLVGYIKAAGGTYTRKGAEADVFVTYYIDRHGNPTDKCSRRDELDSEREIMVISLDKLLELLGKTRRELEESPLIEEDYFLFPEW